MTKRERVEAALRRVAGTDGKPYFRVPFGEDDPALLALLGERGYVVADWAVDTNDWRETVTEKQVTERVVRDAKEGDIGFMLGYLYKTAHALPAMVEGLKKRGLRPAPLSEVLR
jgi:peptidoglycan/xylan/chitin deacetylase (PgdA/CDA1 family)